MKFTPPEEPKVDWTPSMLQERIEKVGEEVKELSRELNATQKELSKIFEKRFQLGQKIGNKRRYQQQLRDLIKQKTTTT